MICTFRPSADKDIMAMTLTDFYWRFICENSEYRDCELLTASGVYFTNRCFLQYSGLIEETVDDGYLIISMPEFSLSDVNQKLNGYITPQKSILIQAMKTDELEQTCDSNMSGGLDSSSNQMTEIHQPCVEEKEEFIKSTEIKRHSAAEQKVYICEMCGLTFSSPKKRWNHKDQVHRSGTSFQCHICSAHFKTKSILSNHMKCHRLPSFPCPYCSKAKTIKLS